MMSFMSTILSNFPRQFFDHENLKFKKMAFLVYGFNEDFTRCLQYGKIEGCIAVNSHEMSLNKIKTELFEKN